ncbi:unnamed protein product [Notodromas monacha]|uniref:AAA+ ATPase domain-containing protein n=1 Tax=Notodromas monacha TaxID=399045 RepID=A0A7R9GAS2_9CRUS|nr:unnamed protein product [Notodromas monacha]CAG0914330.1 unnamed protein product [Notodromas monacha]
MLVEIRLGGRQDAHGRSSQEKFNIPNTSRTKEDNRPRQKMDSKSSQGVQTPSNSGVSQPSVSSKSKSKQQSYSSSYSPVKTAAVMGIPRNPETLPGSPIAGGGGGSDRPKTRVKVCGSTQTPDVDYGKPALSANVRERILANYAQSGNASGTAIMYSRRGMKTDGSLSDSNYSNYADLMSGKEYSAAGEGVYSWASRHYSAFSPAAAPFRRFGSLTEGESMESLSSTASSIAAQIQNARANSLTQTKILLQQQHQSQANAPGSPRLNRSSSARSNKSEKLYTGLSSDMMTRLSFSNASGVPGGNGGLLPGLEGNQPGSPLPGQKPGYGMSAMSVPPSPYSSGADRHGQQGSLRTDDAHGSAISLVSTGSSLYSGQQGTNTSASVSVGGDETAAPEYRRMKRELLDSQKKIHSLTTQLATNAHVVAAFEQSLSNMTQRLQQLTSNSEEKDQELNELRRTIDQLRKQSAEMGIHLPNNLSRHLSTESMSSLSSACSVASHASNASHALDSSQNHSSKKKTSNSKKKGWLRSSFSKAFGKAGASGTMSAQATPKKSLSGPSEDFSASVPGSPMMSVIHHHHHNSDANASANSSVTNPAFADSLGEENSRAMLDLKKQLREKDLILTDIRLEALTSAHQLESLKETVIRMRNEMLTLKQDNERLQRLVASKSLNASTNSLDEKERYGVRRGRSNSNAGRSDSLAESAVPQHHSYVDLVGEGKEEGQRISISVALPGDLAVKDAAEDPRKAKPEGEWFIGNIYVSGKTKWEMLDDLVGKIFKEYLFRVDPAGQLGLSENSVSSYVVGEILRDPWEGTHGEGVQQQQLPELLPCGYLVGDVQNIKLGLRDGESSVDTLVFETLTPKAVIQRYVSLLTEHRRIILSGPSGTGKSYLARKLAEYLVRRSGVVRTADSIATFSVDEKSAGELQAYLMHLADQCESANGAGDLLPRVIILDNLHRAGSLSDVFSGFLNSANARCPTIIGTMSQTATTNTTNLQLHHNFRWILCANHMEPVSGFLARHLRRRLIESEVKAGSKNPEMSRVLDWVARVWSHVNKFLETHASSDVTLGPRLFLSCPLDVESSRVWFTDLWNYSIVPYAINAVKEGLQLYGKKSLGNVNGSSSSNSCRGWEDPATWVLQTWPWTRPPSLDASLIRIRPEDVGFTSVTHRRHSASTAASTSGHGQSDIMTSSTHSAGSLMVLDEDDDGFRIGPDESESDPLVKMLRKLQAAAADASVGDPKNTLVSAEETLEVIRVNNGRRANSESN